MRQSPTREDEKEPGTWRSARRRQRPRRFETDADGDGDVDGEEGDGKEGDGEDGRGEDGGSHESDAGDEGGRRKDHRHRHHGKTKRASTGNIQKKPVGRPKGGGGEMAGEGNADGGKKKQKKQRVAKSAGGADMGAEAGPGEGSKHLDEVGGHPPVPKHSVLDGLGLHASPFSAVSAGSPSDSGYFGSGGLVFMHYTSSLADRGFQRASEALPPPEPRHQPVGGYHPPKSSNAAAGATLGESSNAAAAALGESSNAAADALSAPVDEAAMEAAFESSIREGGLVPMHWDETFGEAGWQRSAAGEVGFAPRATQDIEYARLDLERAGKQQHPNDSREAADSARDALAFIENAPHAALPSPATSGALLSPRGGALSPLGSDIATSGGLVFMHYNNALADRGFQRASEALPMPEPRHRPAEPQQPRDGDAAVAAKGIDAPSSTLAQGSSCDTPYTLLAQCSGGTSDASAKHAGGSDAGGSAAATRAAQGAASPSAAAATDAAVHAALNDGGLVPMHWDAALTGNGWRRPSGDDAGHYAPRTTLDLEFALHDLEPGGTAARAQPPDSWLGLTQASPGFAISDAGGGHDALEAAGGGGLIFYSPRKK
jgi:hypothetical protein